MSEHTNVLIWLKVGLWNWCQIWPGLKICRSLSCCKGGKYIVRSILECGSEVPRSSSSCSKARSCRACLGFPWDALWTVACGMGTKSFFRNWLCSWLCSFPAETWTVFHLFSCFIGRNPIENTWSDTITAWAFKTFGMPQLSGELRRGWGHQVFCVIANLLGY